MNNLIGGFTIAQVCNTLNLVDNDLKKGLDILKVLSSTSDFYSFEVNANIRNLSKKLATVNSFKHAIESKIKMNYSILLNEFNDGNNTNEDYLLVIVEDGLISFKTVNTAYCVDGVSVDTGNLNDAIKTAMSYFSITGYYDASLLISMKLDLTKVIIK